MSNPPLWARLLPGYARWRKRAAELAVGRLPNRIAGLWVDLSIKRVEELRERLDG